MNERIIKRIANLMSVKSIVTLVLTGVFAYMAVTGNISQDFMTIYAVIIAFYTLVDGAGARASGNAVAYVCWLTFLEGLPYLAWIRATRGPPAFAYLAKRWRRGIAGGAASLAAYGIALWAMTRAPVAVVAALREVSVLFAAAIGALVLNEGFGWRRMAGAAAVVAGVAALRL